MEVTAVPPSGRPSDSLVMTDLRSGTFTLNSAGLGGAVDALAVGLIGGGVDDSFAGRPLGFRC